MKFGDGGKTCLEEYNSGSIGILGCGAGGEGDKSAKIKSPTNMNPSPRISCAGEEGREKTPPLG